MPIKKQTVTVKWEVSRDAVPAWHTQFTVYDGEGQRVATVFQSEANARLITAAPALLKALKAVLPAGDLLRPTDEYYKEFDDAEDAIRQAESP